MFIIVYLRSSTDGWNIMLHSLVFEVLNHARHLMQVRLKLDFLVTQVVQLSAQVGDVGFEHGVNIGARWGLFLHKFPFGLKHFVLLFQEANLQTEKVSEWLMNRKQEKTVL